MGRQKNKKWKRRRTKKKKCVRIAGILALTAANLYTNHTYG